jgi:hypothetical protein
MTNRRWRQPLLPRRARRECRAFLFPNQKEVGHMAHGITTRDSLMVVPTPAWHGLGVVLDHTPRSVEGALAPPG